MAEYSLPMPGTTIGDAGPYAVGGAAGLGWWDKWAVEARAGGRLSQVALADIGVFYCVDDQLECTEAADTTSIDVDEGAALVDGLMYHNDTDPVNVPIPAAGAGDDRIDLVVVRKNYSAVTTYTPGGGAPTVGPREGRITVIRGTEAVGPVAPTVTQDMTRATYWDIPLCSVQVDDAGALTDLTDLREYVDAEIKRIFVPAHIGYNNEDSVEIILTSGWALNAQKGPRIIMLDGDDCYGMGRLRFPHDYIDEMTSTAIVMSAAGAASEVYCDNQCQAAACSEEYDTHFLSTGRTQATYAAGAITYKCIQELSITGLDENDFMLLIFRRDASNALDTLDADLWFFGWIIEYLGWRR